MSTDHAGMKHSPVLISTSVFAVFWVTARACVQSITIDEADSYTTYALRPVPSGWEGSANNQVLNSLLMRLSTMIFGASAFTIRLPALIGAAIYIAAVYFLVRLIAPRRVLQWSLLVCLVYNPFVMDYLVAARGYSMALAFLTCAVALAAWQRASGASPHRTAALISVCAALSVSANFSFAIVDAVTMALIALWIGRDRAARGLKTGAAFVLPGLAVCYFFVGSVLLSWPKGQFSWGTHSLLKTGDGILKAALYEPNPYLLNPRLYGYVVRLGPWLYPLLGVFFLWRVAALCRQRTAGRHAELAIGCSLALAITLACHQFLYSAYGILLPEARTGLYIALLCLVMAGAAAAIPCRSLAGRASGSAMTVMLALIACYSIGCLRLTYFKEWKWDADMKNVYSVLAYYNRAYGVTDVSTNWRYVAALNCYRELSGRETLHPIGGAPTEVAGYADGFPVYVVYYPDDEVFFKREKLKVVYHDGFTDAAVAIRPEVEIAGQP